MIHDRDFKISCLSKEVDRYKTMMIEKKIDKGGKNSKIGKIGKRL